MRRVARGLAWFILAALSLATAGLAAVKQDASKPDDARLKPAYRFERGGWVYVHLEGSPADIGYQHGFLLAPEIEAGFKTVQFNDVYRTKRDWNSTARPLRTFCGRTSRPSIGRSYRASPTA